MREDNLLCLRDKKRSSFKTTDSNHNLAIYPNLAKDMYPNMKLTDINQLWVSDITYIRLPSEFLYLAVIAVILDVFSRKCIGWNLDDSLETTLTLTLTLTLTALNMALESRWHQGLKEKLIHHSDRGVQYASSEYVDILKAHNILISCRKLHLHSALEYLPPDEFEQNIQKENLQNLQPIVSLLVVR